MFRLPNEENFMSFYTEMLINHLTEAVFICKLRTLPGRKLLWELKILSGIYSGTVVVPSEFGPNYCFTFASENEK